ncbi:hypothetical protein C8J56DRAFT_794339, partial [Mycena floridula]
IRALEPLEVYVTDRVALLGDTAHAMEPHLGAGAGQAVEDAWILGRTISRLNCTSSRVPEVLQRYSTIRQPYANMILTNARAQGLLYGLTNRLISRFRAYPAKGRGLHSRNVPTSGKQDPE